MDTQEKFYLTQEHIDNIKAKFKKLNAESVCVENSGFKFDISIDPDDDSLVVIPDDGRILYCWAGEELTMDLNDVLPNHEDYKEYRNLTEIFVSGFKALLGVLND